MAEPTTSSLPLIAFLGIGLMGKPMALRLLAAGYPVRVWNRNPDKARALCSAGAQWQPELAATLQGASVVLSMLADGPALLQVTQQALPHLSAGSLWLDMSSTRQDEAREMQGMLAAHGVGFVDAPVSGGVIGAEQGNLAIMAGGEVEHFQRLLPVLQVLGRPTLVGAAGCGQLAKLCNQLIVGAQLQVVAEALCLAQAGGADPAAVRQALRGGFADSRVLEVHGARMLARDFRPGGQIKTQVKDLQNVLHAADTAKLDLPLAQLLLARFQDLLPEWAGADQAAALLGVERRNQPLRVGTGEDILPISSGEK